MGESLKNAAGSALESVKGHVNTLGEKLKGHVDELKNHGEKILGHGSDALNALKDAVGDIISKFKVHFYPCIFMLGYTYSLSEVVRRPLNWTV